MESRVTAQLIVSPSEAYVAISHDINPIGPHGEPRRSAVIHTRDAGRTWVLLPWKRDLLSKIRYFGHPTWPPESVSELKCSDGQLVIIHRDEWVPFEPGGESLWESVYDGSKWRYRKIRAMDYKGKDTPRSIPAIKLDLPEGMILPSVDRKP